MRAALGRAAAAEARAAAAEAQVALAAASAAAAASAPCATCVAHSAGPRVDLSPAVGRPPVVRDAACPAAATREVTHAAWAGAAAAGIATADAAVQAVPPRESSLATGCPASTPRKQAGQADAAVQVTLQPEASAAEGSTGCSRCEQAARRHAAVQAVRPEAPCGAAYVDATCALHVQTGPRATTADAAVQAAAPPRAESGKLLQEGLAEGAVRPASGGGCRACGAGRADEHGGMQRMKEPCSAEAGRQADRTPAPASQRPVCRPPTAGRPGAAAAAENDARAAIQCAPEVAAVAYGWGATLRGAAGARPASCGGPAEAAAAAHVAGPARCAEPRDAAGGAAGRLQDVRACAGGDGGQGCKIQGREGLGRPQLLQRAQGRAPADARASVSISQVRLQGYPHPWYRWAASFPCSTLLRERDSAEQESLV